MAQLRGGTPQDSELRATLRDTADFRTIAASLLLGVPHGTPSSSLLAFAEINPYRGWNGF